MCGIVGFTGEHQAAPILLDGLAKLEYRGYDSAGIAVRDGDADVKLIMENLYLEHVVSDIPDGQLIETRLRTMHIRIKVMTEM